MVFERTANLTDYKGGIDLLKRRKGMTLVEVLAAAVVLFIIGLSFSGSLAKQFTSLKDTETITKDTFSTVKRTEQEIQLIKDSVKSGDSVDSSRYQNLDIDLFSGTNKRTVSVYKIENGIKEYKGDITEADGAIKPDDNIAPNKIIAFVPTKEGVELPTVTIEDVKITYHAEKGITSDYIAQKGRYENEKITGSHTSPKPASLALQTNYQWYVSREGYYKIYSEHPEEIEVGNTQPRFKADYTPIPGENSINLSKIEEKYMGKFLILEVRSASIDGKISGVKVSNPIYVSGVYRYPDSKIEYLHFDASLYNTDSDKIIKSGGKKYLTEWEEIYNSDEIKAVADDASTAPEIITEKRNKPIEINDPAASSSKKIKKEVFYDFLRFTGSEKLEALLDSKIKRDKKSGIMFVLRVPELGEQNHAPFLLTNGDAYESHSPGNSIINDKGVSKSLNYNGAKMAEAEADKDKWMIMEVYPDNAGDYVVEINGIKVINPGSAIDKNFNMNKLIFGQNYDGSIANSKVDLAEFLYFDDYSDTYSNKRNFGYLVRKYNIEAAYKSMVE